MHRPPIRILAFAFANIVLIGCACIHPQSCVHRQDPRVKIKLINDSFCAVPVQTTQRQWTVCIPKKPQNGNGPPVLLLHEMPALTAQDLDLGLRLNQAGYSVYIPLLFGKATDDPQSQVLGIRRGIAMRSDKNWLAGEGNVHRPIVDQIASLCREYILPRHKGQRLGVIGMCFTGVLPIALLGQKPELSQLAAPVVSQPAIPLPSCNHIARAEAGLSDEELRIAIQRVHDNHTEILGFRFQGDGVSPPERFATLRNAFSIKGRQYFIDRTIPEWDYVKIGRLPPRSHSVLAECYQQDRSPDAELSSTEVAWQRLLNFLHAKLGDSDIHRYVEKYPTRLLK